MPQKLLDTFKVYICLMVLRGTCNTPSCRRVLKWRHQFLLADVRHKKKIGRRFAADNNKVYCVVVTAAAKSLSTAS